MRIFVGSVIEIVTVLFKYGVRAPPKIGWGLPTRTAPTRRGFVVTGLLALAALVPTTLYSDAIAGISRMRWKTCQRFRVNRTEVREVPTYRLQTNPPLDQ